MNSIKCKGCGANLNYDGSRQIIKCEYCGTIYKDEAKYQKVNTPTDDQIATMKSALDGYSEVQGDRPKMNWLVFILLMFFFMFAIAILYFVIIKARQREWDKAHGIKRENILDINDDHYDNK